MGDYDGDGGQDILAPVGGFIGEAGGLMHNLSARANNWLEIELDEINSAPDGCARVILHAGGRTQARDVHYSPVETFRIHFGLGEATIADLIEIRWPSGVVQVVRNVPVNQRISMNEGIPCPDREGGQCPRVEIDIDPDTDGNLVNLRSNELLRVAILGTEDLDVADIDSTTFFFAAGRAAPQHRIGTHVEDVNDDDLLDLVSHYRIPETGIEYGDVAACLRGQMLDRTPVGGCDRISTSEPTKEKEKKK